MLSFLTPKDRVSQEEGVVKLAWLGNKRIHRILQFPKLNHARKFVCNPSCLITTEMLFQIGTYKNVHTYMCMLLGRCTYSIKFKIPIHPAYKLRYFKT